MQEDIFSMDFDPTKVEVERCHEKGDTCWYVTLNSYNRKPVAKTRFFEAGKATDFPDWDTVIFSFRKREKAERVAKAFSHAITLCGGRVEPF